VFTSSPVNHVFYPQEDRFMTLQIIGFAMSNFVRSVRMVAEERNVPYELLPVTPGSKEARAAHPLGQVPAMNHDGFELFESQSIARYIDSAFEGSRMTPDDEKGAAAIDQWVAFAATSVDQYLMRRYVVPYVFYKDGDGNTDRTLIDMTVPGFEKLFGAINAGVADGYLGDSDFNMADCFLVPILVAASNFPEAKEAIEATENLAGYIERVSQRQSFADTGS
jgi:glutathione S-transferase